MNKLKIFFTGSLFFLASILFAQKNEKLTNILSHNIELNGINSNYTIWIFFKDKGNNINEKLKKAETNLNKRSLERRQKLIKNKSIVSFYDIPVEQSYIDSVSPYLLRLRHQSKWLNAVSAEVSGYHLQNIASLNCVKSIDIVKRGKYNEDVIKQTRVITGDDHKNPKYNLNYGSSLTQLEQINIPLIHALGYSGKGVIICVLDAGFNNLEHQVFDKLDTLASYDFVNNDRNVDDEADMGSGSHGTMTLSTIGGFYEGELIGPAYGASYLLAKTENTDSETQTEEDNWVAAIEWAEALGADITSTSLGYLDFDDGTGYSISELDGNTAVITIASDIAASKGILVVNSAGNYGDGITTIIAPADGDSVLTIGAVDSEGVRTSFSSVGPTADNRIKPDLMAMGANVYVADIYGNNYRYANGTSFSCPLAAGATALLREMFPFASNMEIINALKNTANNTNNPDNKYGWGIIDIYAAYQFLSQDYSHSVMFNITDEGKPISDVKVSLKTVKQLTDINGKTIFKDVLASNNIECIVSKPGYSTYYDTISVVDKDIKLEISLEKSSVSVYPIPSTNLIYFDITESVPDNNIEILILDLKGKTVKKIASYYNKKGINISDFSNGIYIAQITINNSVFLKKIIVSK